MMNSSNGPTQFHPHPSPNPVPVPPKPGAIHGVGWRGALRAAIMMFAAAAALAAGTLQSAPVYLLRYAFTNEYYPGVSSYAFANRAIAGINDAGDVCGTFGTSNALDNSTGYAWSVYLLRTNGVVYDLFPRGVTPAVQNAYANNLTQRRADGSLQIVGSVQQADGFQRGAIWTVAADGSISSFVVLTNRVLDTNSVAPGEQGYGEANAINDSGYVVGDGNSYNAEDALNWSPPYTSEPSYWIWNDGADAIGVDDQGTVLVNADFRTSVYPYDKNYQGAALLFGGSPTELPPGGTNNSGSGAWYEVDAMAMAGSNVVGQAYFGSNNPAEWPFAWDRGDAGLTLLPAPDGMAYGQTSCQADSANSAGDIVGYVYNTNFFSTNGADFYPDSYYALWEPVGGGDLRAWRGYALDALLPAQPGFHTFGGGSNPQNYDIAINDNEALAVHAYSSAGGYYDPSQKYYETIMVYQPVTNGIVQFFDTNVMAAGNNFTALKSDGSITASVELVRPAGSLAPVTVHFATSDGTGVAGQDYVATNGDLVWGYGESDVKTIVVQFVTNNYAYGDHLFYLNLSSPNGAETGMNNAAMTISAEDYAENIIYTNLTPSPFSYGNEYDVRAGATNVVVTLTRQGPFDGTMTITNFFTSASSAIPGTDYLDFTNTTSVTWTPGQVGRISYSIPLLGNTNLPYGPVYFNVEVDGTIDATNYVSNYGVVGIMPTNQVSPFQFGTITAPAPGGTMSLMSFVEQGVTVELQSSTNLVDWTTVTQLVCTNGVVQFDPLIEQKEPGRYYREFIPGN